METPTTEEVALLNSCLRAITPAGSDVARIADTAGVSTAEAEAVLDVMERDGVVYSFSFWPLRKYYKLRTEDTTPPYAAEINPGGFPWCSQCDCYHYTTGPCTDEAN